MAALNNTFLNNFLKTERKGAWQTSVGVQREGVMTKREWVLGLTLLATFSVTIFIMDCEKWVGWIVVLCKRDFDKYQGPKWLRTYANTATFRSKLP